MSSTRETAVAALAELLRQTGAQVWRDTDLPETIPPSGLMTVSEGDFQSTPIMSPPQWEIDLSCEVQIDVVAADERTRDAALDALLSDVAARIVADRTLGGAVQWTEPTGVTFDAAEIDGAAKVARLTVTLSFTTRDTILS